MAVCLLEVAILHAECMSCLAAAAAAAACASFCPPPSLPGAPAAGANEDALIESLAASVGLQDDISLEQKDLMGVVLGAVPAEDGLDLIGQELEDAEPAVEGLTQVRGGGGSGFRGAG